MNNNNATQKPDFVVQWNERSHLITERLYWDFEKASRNNRLRDGAVSLHTETTHIEVSEIRWSEPTTLTFEPNLIGLTLLVSSSANITYDYGHGKHKTVNSGETGKLLFMVPGREIRARMSPGKIHTVTCSFERRYAESVIGPLDDLSPAKLYNALDMPNSLIPAILLRLMQEAVNPGPISDDIARTFGHAILAECSHWLLLSGDAKRSRRHLSAADLAMVEQRLSDAAGRFPGVGDLAAACGLSERYFAKLFRQQTGLSVSEHIRAIRIARAKSLLGETDLPLKEIAFQLGYSSSANFSSAFRAATGTTPGQFRKQ